MSLLGNIGKLLGDENGVLEDLATIAHLDYRPCEGPTHPTGLFGHHGDAEWLVTLGCGTAYEVCDGWIRYLRECEGVRCTFCGTRHLVVDVGIVPLGSAS